MGPAAAADVRHARVPRSATCRRRRAPRSRSPRSRRRSSSSCIGCARATSASASYHRALIEENKWRAARWGIDGKLIDFGKRRRGADARARARAARVRRRRGGRAAAAGARSSTCSTILTRRDQRRAAAAGLPGDRRSARGRALARRRDPRRASSDGAAQLSRMTMKVGLLCGREYSFPPAFLDRVNTLGAPHGITAEFVKLTGTKMGEPSGYRVIVDRISHEVECISARYLKHAVLEGTYVINNPFWWTRRRQVLQLLGGAQARRRRARRPSCCRRRPIRPDIDLDPGVAAQPGLSDRLGRPARLRRPSRDPEAVLRRRLEARLQGRTTAPSCSRPTTAPRRTA